MAAKKVMVIGLDAAIAPNVYKYAREGHMPRVKHLLDNGVCGTNCLPAVPQHHPAELGDPGHRGHQRDAQGAVFQRAHSGHRPGRHGPGV